MVLNFLRSYKFKLSLILLLIVFLGMTFSIYIYLNRAAAPMDGQLNLSGLKSKVEIIRDENGIPHIFAENRLDAFYSLGFVMASERLFQMEISRRVAEGELSEIIGDKGLESDKMFRSLRIKSSMQKMLDQKLLDHQFDPNMWAQMDSFYRGVNDYQNTHPTPIEFKILGISPRPFSPIDAYSFIGLMSFNFAIGTMQDPLLTTLEKRLGPDLVNEMRLEQIPKLKKSVFSYERVFNNSKIHNLISFLETGYPLFEGSNGWLLSKKRTTTGTNLLANDPHISFPHPGIWFEASIHTPDFESYGHYLSLIPFPILSHNKNRAWGLTMSLADDMDVYKETVEGEKYLFKNNWYDLTNEMVSIPVKGKKDYQFNLRSSGHGPFMDEVLPEKNLALKWTFHHPKNDPLSSLYQMGEAHTMDDFKKAVASGISPGLNILYADKDNIAWWIFGEVVVRSPKSRSDFVLDGSSGDDEYIGVMSFDQKPHLENPESGVIISANSRPVGFPDNQRGDFQPDDRFKSIQAVLNQKEKWSVEETKEVQTLSMNFENKLILDQLLIDIADVKLGQEYKNLLLSWNLNSDKNSSSPTLFYVFLNKIGLRLLKDLNQHELETFGRMPMSNGFIKRVVLDRDNIWWKKYDRKNLIQASYIDAIDFLKNKFGNDSKNWMWGKIHTIEFSHPVGKVWPLNYLFNLGPYPVSGATQDINNLKSNNFKDTFEVKAGPSTRRIISFDNINDAQGILPVGESGHLLSPYYSNQVERYLKGIYRPMRIEKSIIKENASHILILNPTH
jgi:penicillin amidase